jgi:uncharacterized protein GlcG (DUF336 family)
MFTRAHMSLADARTAAQAAHDEAAKNGWKLTIAIVDAGGHLLHLERMDGAMPMTIELSIQKARTAAMAGRATKPMEDTVNGGKFSILAAPGVTPLEGGIPLFYKDELVGGIGASGANSAQDAQCGMAAAEALNRIGV